MRNGDGRTCSLEGRRRFHVVVVVLLLEEDVRCGRIPAKVVELWLEIGEGWFVLEFLRVFCPSVVEGSEGGDSVATGTGEEGLLAIVVVVVVVAVAPLLEEKHGSHDQLTA